MRTQSFPLSPTFTISCDVTELSFHFHFLSLLILTSPSSSPTLLRPQGTTQSSNPELIVQSRASGQPTNGAIINTSDPGWTNCDGRTKQQNHGCFWARGSFSYPHLRLHWILQVKVHYSSTVQRQQEKLISECLFPIVEQVWKDMLRDHNSSVI